MANGWPVFVPKVASYFNHGDPLTVIVGVDPSYHKETGWMGIRTEAPPASIGVNCYGEDYSSSSILVVVTGK